MKTFYDLYNKLPPQDTTKGFVQKLKSAFLEANHLDDKAVKQEMKDKKISPYSFRHTYITWLEAGGVPDNVVSYESGHIDENANKMNANYNHINKLDNKTLFEAYLKPVADCLLKYLIPKDKTILNPPDIPAVPTGKWGNVFGTVDYGK
jgi:hypothetical protein